MPIPAEYRTWLEFALAIAGARKTSAVSRTSWLCPLLKDVAEEEAETARRPKRALIR